MKNWFSKLFANIDEVSQTGLRINLIMVGASISSLPIYIYLILQSGTWQIYVVAATVTAFLILTLTGVSLARRNQGRLSMGIALVSLAVIVPVLVAMISGLGIVLAIATMLIFAAISAQTNMQARTRRALILGAVSSAATLLIDFRAPWERVSYPLLNNFIPIIAVIIVAVFGFQFFGGSNLWRQWNLGRKLLVAFSALALIALVVGVIGNIGLSRVQNSYKDALAKGEEVQIDSLHLSNDLLTARRHEKDFLARWTIEGFDTAYANYVVTNQAAVAEIFDHIDQLSTFAPVVGQDLSSTYPQSQYESDLSVLKESTNTYDQDFQKTVQLIKERGFQDTGLEGQFRTDVHAFEDKIIGRDDLSPLVITMLTIRRHEKDYLLRGDQTYIDQTHQSVIDLKQQIAASDVLQPAEKKELTTLADQYVVSFDALVEKDVEIAASVQAFRDAAHIMEPLVDKLANAGSELAQIDVDRAEINGTQTLSYSVITLVVALLSALFLSVALSRQITRPVLGLTVAAHELETGNYDTQTEVTSGDELGILAGTFNTMASRLKEAFATISKRAKELQSVAEIATQASQATDAQEMLQKVVDLTKSSYNLYHAHIYLLDDAQTELVLTAGVGEVGQQMVSEERKISLNHQRSLVARAARSGQGAISNDVTKEPDFLPNPLLPDTKSEMAIPIAIGDKVLGVLDVQADYVNRFTDEDIAINTTLAQQVATSLQNIRAAELSAKRATELQSVAEIATQASQATNIQDMLQIVADGTKSGYSLYHAHIYLLDDNKTSLTLTSGAGEVGRQMVNEKRTIPLNHPHSLVARAARTAQGAISNDITKEPDFLPNPLLPDTKAEMAIPIKSGDKVFGVLDVQADYVNRFTEEDISIKTTLAQQIASSLENLRQYEISQKIAHELEVVANVSTATASITDAKLLLQEVVDQTKAVFNLYHAHVYLLNEAGDTLELAAGAGDVGKKMLREGRQIPLDSEKSLVARAARTHSGAVVNDVQADPDFLPNPLLPQTRSEMAIPMIVGGKVVGVLDVQSELLNRFTEIDVNIKTTLAAQTAVALQNARTFANAHKQAERESMLNTIGQKIQSATSVEAVLQIAARELGRALDAPMTIAQLGMHNKAAAGVPHNGNGNGNGH